MVGDKAKEFIINKVLEVLSDNYLGTQDKKHYFNSKENGETKVVCLSLTCPKVIPEFAISTTPLQTTPTGDFDWSDAPVSTASKSISTQPATEITQEEIDTVAAMLERLNL